MNWVPYKKRSKKKKREEEQKQRHTWGSFKPVTRVSKNEKTYDRNKEKKNLRKWLNN